MEISNLYCKKIKLIDEHKYIERTSRASTFYVQFANKLVVNKNQGDIFSKTNKVTEIKKHWKDDTLIVDTSLPKVLSFELFKLLLAGVLEVHVDALNFGKYDFQEFYDKSTVLGNTDLEIPIKPVQKPRNNGYLMQVLPQLEKINKFLETLNNNKVHTEKLVPFYTQLNYIMYYDKDLGKFGDASNDYDENVMKKINTQKARDREEVRDWNVNTSNMTITNVSNGALSASNAHYDNTHSVETSVPNTSAPNANDGETSTPNVSNEELSTPSTNYDNVHYEALNAPNTNVPNVHYGEHTSSVKFDRFNTENILESLNAETSEDENFEESDVSSMNEEMNEFAQNMLSNMFHESEQLSDERDENEIIKSIFSSKLHNVHSSNVSNGELSDSNVHYGETNDGSTNASDIRSGELSVPNVRSSNMNASNVNYVESTSPNVHSGESSVPPDIHSEVPLSSFDGGSAFSRIKAANIPNVPKSISMFEIDIIRLFNINKTSNKFSKIRIHSDKLNDFKNEINPLSCIVKTNKPSLRPLLGLDGSKNECVVLCQMQVFEHESIRLSNIEFLENGLIIFNFKNFRNDVDKSELTNIIEKFMKKESYDLLNELHLEECVYRPNFSVNQLKIQEYTHTSFTHIPTKSRISHINPINVLDCFNTIYSTKTSIREVGPQSNSLSTRLLFKNIANIGTNFQLTTMNFYFYPIVQVNKVPGGIRLEIRGSTSVENSEMITSLIVGTLSLVEKQQTNRKLSAIEKIDAELTSIDQNIRVNQLKTVDSVLFGNRMKNGLNRDYSQLVQSNEQRPSVITEKEYKLLKNERPDSVLNIENQMTGKRLYLYCPFKEYPVANYHNEKGQLCVVKCTLHFANPAQYKYCDAQLDGNDNRKEMNPQFSSNTVVKFTKSLESGRRCYLPDELAGVFPKSYLLKLRKDEDFRVTIADKYNMICFVVQRMEDSYIVNTEYLFDGESYAFIIQIENTDDYYLMVEAETGKPYEFNSKNDNKFVQQLIYISKTHNKDERFTTYINNVMGTKFTNNDSIADIVKKLYDKNIIFYRSATLHSNTLIGMNYKGHLYIIPEVLNPEVHTEKITKYLAKFQQSKDLPSLKELKTEGISKYYVDLENVIIAVNYYGTVTLTQCARINDLKSSMKEYIDPAPFIFKIFGFETTVVDKPILHTTILDTNMLLSYYIVICLQTNGKVTKELMEKTLEKFIADKTDLQYNEHVLAWRKSKISKNIIEKLDYSQQNIVKLLYEHYKDNSNLKFDDANEYVYETSIY